jgi:hypothetical protein
VKVIKQPSKKYYDQPNLEVADWAAGLKVPIIGVGATVNIGITFSFQFSDNGYYLKVIKGMMLRLRNPMRLMQIFHHLLLLRLFRNR